jgi:hypothetical protein
MPLAARLKRYEIRAANQTKKEVAKWNAISTMVKEFLNILKIYFQNQEATWALTTELINRLRADASTYYERGQTFTLLNQAIGSANNMRNLGAIAGLFNTQDVIKLYEALQPRVMKLKTNEKLEVY